MTANKILQDYYIGSSKLCIISMFCELTSLKKSTDESVTDYLHAACTWGCRRTEEYKPFTTVIIQQDLDKLTFDKFKSSLENYDENEKALIREPVTGDTIVVFNGAPL